MRVLGVGKFYPPEYYGGLESAVVALHAELVRRGVAVTCVVAAVRGAGGISEVDGVRVVRARTLWTVLSQPVAPGLPALVRREAGDVVHLHHPNPLGDLAVLSDRARPLVVTQHSDVVRQRALWPLYGPLVRRAFARARRIVVASEQYVASSRELRGFEDKVRVIPYGIDGARFEPRPDRALSTTSIGSNSNFVQFHPRFMRYSSDTLYFVLKFSRSASLRMEPRLPSTTSTGSTRLFAPAFPVPCRCQCW